MNDNVHGWILIGLAVFLVVGSLIISAADWWEERVRKKLEREKRIHKNGGIL